MTEENLRDEGLRATKLLEGLTVKSVFRHRPTEVVVIFTDGSHFYVDWREDKSVELSITTGGNKTDDE